MESWLKVWTERHLQTLLLRGEVHGFGVTTRTRRLHSFLPNQERSCRERNWLLINVRKWAEDRDLLILENHRFHQPRFWRFSWTFPALQVAIHFELFPVAHEAEMYHTAQLLGWSVIRLTPGNYQDVFSLLDQFM